MLVLSSRNTSEEAELSMLKHEISDCSKMPNNYSKIISLNAAPSKEIEKLFKCWKRVHWKSHRYKPEMDKFGNHGWTAGCCWTTNVFKKRFQSNSAAFCMFKIAGCQMSFDLVLRALVTMYKFRLQLHVFHEFSTLSPSLINHHNYWLWQVKQTTQ